MPAALHIDTFSLGAWSTNCFVVSAGDACWIVDAGFEPEPMLDALRTRGLTPSQVVLTHAHLDHIGGLWDIRRAFPDIPILIHEAERRFLTDTALNLSSFLGDPVVAPEATGFLHHGDTLKLLPGIDFHVRHTPGHSPGNVCLYQPEAKVALVGDTLFAGSIGRYDFPTSDGPTLLRSIRDQLLTLPDDTAVLPGHGPETTIGDERRTNPYLR